MTESKQPELGMRLRAAMKERGINAAALSRIVGVTPQAVNGWLTRGTMRKEYAIEVARLLGLSAEELISGDEAVTAPALNQDESDLLRLYRTLDERAQRGVRLLIDSLAEPAPRYGGPKD